MQTDRGQRQVRKILEALAVANAQGDLPFDEMLLIDGVRLNRNDIVLAISADPRPDWARALRELRRRGVNNIAVVIDGSTFGGRRPFEPLMHELELSAIPTYAVKRDQSIADALSATAGWEFRRW